MKKHIHILWLVCILFTTGVTAQNYTQQVTAIQYYFNADPGTGVAGNGAIVPVTPSGTISQSFDITLPSDLPTGSNQLYVRVMDEWGQWSIAERRTIYIINPTVTQDITAIQYFFDSDPGVGITGNGGILSVPQSSAISQALAVDMPSELEEGFHNLFIRTKNVTGQWSIAERRSFYLVKPPTGNRITAIQYFFDNDPGTGIPGNGGILEVQPGDTLSNLFNFEISETLSDGIHQLYFRVKNEDGTWSMAERRSFIVGDCTPAGLENLTAWWPFDAESSTGVDNLAGNQDGILVNGATTSLHAYFDGVDDYIGVPDDTLWAFGTEDFSIDFMVNFFSVGGDLSRPGSKFIGQSEGPGNSRKWTFAHTENLLFFRLSDGTTSQNLVQCTFTPTTGQWYHLALTRNADTLRTYIDGQPAAYEVVTGLNIPDVSSALTIGNVDWLQGNDGYIHGYLDEMTIHGKTLSAEEISNIAEAGIAGKCKSLQIITTLLPDAQLGKPYAHTMEAIFGFEPLSWALAEGSLPDGLTMNTDGLIQGTPEVAGDFEIIIEVSDPTGSTAQKTFTISVLLALPAPEFTIFKSGTTAVPGRELDYFILVENTGTVAVDSIIVEELLHPYFHYVSSSPACTVVDSIPNYYTEEDTTDIQPLLIQWIVSLDPGESVVINYKVRLDPNILIGDTVVGQAYAYTPDGCLTPSEALDCLNELLDDLASAAKDCKGRNYYRCFTLKGLLATAKWAKCILDEGADFNWECIRWAPWPEVAQGPVDPNEKLVLTEKYIQPDQVVPYVVHFENIGTIEALDVFVTDTLDPNIDEATLNILTPAGASFNPVSRVLKWNLYGINLLPDSSGYVLFSAAPKQGLPSGTVIRNKASIQFEVFDIFTTNETENIIDYSAPEGVMADLPDTMYQTSFPVSWSGVDSVGEIRRFSLYVATDSGAYVPYYSHATDTTTIFTGETGKSYHFICIAEDLAGNQEVQAPVAETSTYIDVLCFDRWFPDRDHDGYGDGSYPSLSCTHPAGYVTDSTDCDDRNSTIHPGAAEPCNFLDDDCDGQTDEDRLTVSVSVAASANPVSGGVPVTFTATPVNGGSYPSYQWFVNGNVVSAATGSAYTYTPSNNDSIRCTLISSEECTVGNTASASVVMTVTSTVPMTLTIFSATLGSGTERCYNATFNIDIAYNNGSYVVQSGASATMIAGKRITLHPGTKVHAGGYLHAYIAPSGPWCSGAKSSITEEEETEDLLSDATSGKHLFSLYPNPTRDMFTIRWKGELQPGRMQVDVINTHGRKVVSVTTESSPSSDISLGGLPAGLYYVRVVTPGYSGIRKIIKQ